MAFRALTFSSNLLSVTFRREKISRLVILAACSLAGLLAVALLAVNLYVHVAGHTRADSAGAPASAWAPTLRIRRISVTPWFGLKLTGITMPQSGGAVGGDFLQAETFRLRVRLASLFSRRLIISEVSLINPNVMWPQNDDGKWRLPSSLLPNEEETADQPGAEAGVQPIRHLPLPRVLRRPKCNVHHIPTAIEVAASSSTPEVRRVNLTNGNFHFLDVKGTPVAIFEGVGFRSNLRNSTELRGNASIARISLRNRFFLKDLKSPVKYDPVTLDFSQISAHAAGGEISGKFSMQPAEAESPFVAQVFFRDVQADRVVSEAGGPVGIVIGRIEGKLDANGKTADANALSGSGEIFSAGRPDPPVQSCWSRWDELLQIDELRQLQLDQAQVKYHIMPGLVMIDELLLTSPSRTSELSPRPARWIFHGKLDLTGSHLAINDRIRNQLFAGMRESFRPGDEPGYAVVDFQVTGTLARPKTNLIGWKASRPARFEGPGRRWINTGLLGVKAMAGARRRRKKTP